MNSSTKVVAVCLLICGVAACQAFEGYGASVTGGAGRRTVKVTNLKDSGSGSLRAAMNSNRIIQFTVSGVIALKTPISVGANVTIDGFTAPAPGVTITGSSDCLLVTGPGAGGVSANVIIRGLRFRNCGGDEVQIAYGATGVVVDHNSFSGCGDGNTDVTIDSHEVTISWNIYANCGGSFGGSGNNLVKYGSTHHITFHHNLWCNAGGNSRVPWIEAGDDYPNRGTKRVFGINADIRYNVVWNWLLGTLVDTDGRTSASANIVSNLYNGNDPDHARNAIILPDNPLISAYVAGNANVLNPAGCPAYATPPPPRCIKTQNEPSNHAEFPTPKITGPAPNDNQGRLAEWTRVKDEAGLITKFADDSVDASVRSALNASWPNLKLFSLPWNVQP